MRAVAAARAFAVVFGPSVVLDVAFSASVVAFVRALVARRRPAPAAAAGTFAAALHVVVARRWMSRWGMAPGEGAGHAVTIDAPVEAVWPWLAQIGQDRGGFYSYEWLENLAGCRMRNADRVHPEWQHRDVGETVPLHPATGLPVSRFEPGRVFGLQGWGTFELEPLAGGRSRLVARGAPASGPAAWFYALFLEIPHFVMERRMLLGIRARAEEAHDRP